MKMAVVKFKNGNKEEYTNVLNVGFHLDVNQVTIERLGEPTIVYCKEGTKDNNVENDDIIFKFTVDEISIVIVS